MWRLALASLVAVGCFRPNEHQCGDPSDCNGGVCVLESGHCAFVDPGCCGGLVYGEGAGPLAGTCVAHPLCGDAATAPDAPPADANTDSALDASSDAVAHLREVDWAIGTGDWRIEGTVTIDTAGGTVDDPLPNGVSLSARLQIPANTTVWVLRVRSLTVPRGELLRVVGTLPLIIVADSVLVEGTIDAGAKLDVAGGGGANATNGIGAGGRANAGGAASGGGGGAGFGTDGARGGNNTGTPTATGGAAGPSYLDPMMVTLIGGSGGGEVPTGAGCSSARPRGGAGGGALQISARSVIDVDGAIGAGGGGGTAGRRCSSDSEAGTGGGSGGAIYLQAPTIVVRNTGIVAANGGGGGAAPSFLSAGTNGADGGLGSTPAQGGRTSTLASGGNGGAGSTLPTRGTDSNADGGGGGGGVGRIVVRGGAMLTGIVSPPPLVLPN